MADAPTVSPPALVSLPYLNELAENSTLTPEVATVILASVHAGSSRYRAAALAKVSPATFHGWLERANNEPDSAYGALLALILEAEANFESKHIEGATSKARTTDDHLKVLAQHPSHRELWGKVDAASGTQIVVHIGVK